MRTNKAMDWTVFVAGLWLVSAPFLLGYGDVAAAMWNAIIVGTSFMIFGLWAALTGSDSTDRGLNFINAGLGGWLAIAPFVLSYAGTAPALWNDLIIGILVLVVAFTAIVQLNPGDRATAS